MIDKFKNNFGFEPSKQHYAMPNNYKPELNITVICNNTNNNQYLQCISDMQWPVSLGPINIIYVTILLYRYRTAPRKGHLAKIQHLYGYMNKYTSTFIKFNTEIPTYENFNKVEGNRGNLYDVEPEDIPQ